MKIQINTDDNIAGGAELEELTIATVEATLGHLAEQVTRVEVHLSDENSTKSGSAHKHCLLEARLEGHQPLAVTAEAENIEQAIASAADKLKSSLASTLGRLDGR
jgi:ribosome-associated translation inhibitor RaiA